MKVDENSPQNARNCTISKKISWGGMPPNPPNKGSQLRAMYIQIPRNFKVGPPPLRNPAYAPVLFNWPIVSNSDDRYLITFILFLYD